jgi:hypothetical protein
MESAGSGQNCRVRRRRQYDKGRSGKSTFGVDPVFAYSRSGESRELARLVAEYGIDSAGPLFEFNRLADYYFPENSAGREAETDGTEEKRPR